MSRPIEIVRWTIGKAAAEFDLAPATVSKRLKAAGMLPGEDGQYSTRDIVAGLYSDLEANKNKLVIEQTRKVQMENELAERNLIPADLVFRVWDRTILELRNRIQNAPIPKEAKDNLTRELIAAPVEEYWQDAVNEMNEPGETNA